MRTEHLDMFYGILDLHRFPIALHNSSHTDTARRMRVVMTAPPPSGGAVMTTRMRRSVSVCDEWFIAIGKR